MSGKTMTIKNAIEWTTREFRGGFVINPQIEAETVISFVTGLSRTDLHIKPDQELAPEIIGTLKEIVSVRLTGKPLQYILGHQQFRYLEIECREGVLIPRPETELLVEYAIDELKELKAKNEEDCIVVDLGCGTGAIGLSIAYEYSEAFVYLIDKYERSIELTKDNARKTGLENRIKIITSDMFDNISDLKGAVDLIVSNPPYVRSAELATLQREVRFEPRTALDGGTDGLIYYKMIATQAPLILKNGGTLILEIGFDQGDAVVGILREKGYKEIEVKEDYAGLDRIIKAKMS